jgi:hypothetical protein
LYIHEGECRAKEKRARGMSGIDKFLKSGAKGSGGFDLFGCFLCLDIVVESWNYSAVDLGMVSRQETRERGKRL